MSIYYTKADIQHRRWLIADCIADMGAAICCEKRNGNKIEEKEMRKFKLANAYLDLICDYQNLASLFYAGDSVTDVNCITEEQLDKIFAWYSINFTVCFEPKETIAADPNGDIDLPYYVPDYPTETCCLALESGALILVEDSIDDDCIKLETTTCLLAQSPTAWAEYVKALNSYSFYE